MTSHRHDTSQTPVLQAEAARADIAPAHDDAAAPRLARSLVGGFFLTMGGVHIGIVAADAQMYASFADAALVGFVRAGWAEIFMAEPGLWGLAVSLGEILMGVALLVGGRWAKLGWLGVITFHVLLTLFGWGIWVWCVPALVVLITLARRDWPRLGPEAPVGVPWSSGIGGLS